MPKRSTNLDLARAVEKMPETAQECRDYRHSWKLVMMFHSPSFGDTVGRRSVCMRNCGTAKTDYINRVTGEVVARRYSYEAGYQLKGFGGKYKPYEISRAVRIEIIAKAKIEEVSEE